MSHFFFPFFLLGRKTKRCEGLFFLGLLWHLGQVVWGWENAKRSGSRSFGCCNVETFFFLNQAKIYIGTFKNDWRVFVDKHHYINVFSDLLKTELFSCWKRFDAIFLGGFCGQDGPGGRTSPARVCWKAMAGPGVWNLPTPKSASTHGLPNEVAIWHIIFGVRSHKISDMKTGLQR